MFSGSSAVTFWQTEMRHKCFVAWRNARSAQQEKADQLRRKQMLQKGIKALQFAVTQQRQSLVELQTRTSARVMAKYWLKVNKNKLLFLKYFFFLVRSWCGDTLNTRLARPLDATCDLG